jgi:hypothetical protein
MTFFIASSTAQVIIQPSSADNSSSNTSNIGWEFEGSRDLNKGSIKKIEYDGECPGTDPGSITGWFTSSKTLPAPRRRVIVKNVTRGLDSNPYPFTDREYQKGKSSEQTQMMIGTRHRGSNLIIMEGENEFQYEIKENKKVVDSGSFIAVIDQEIDVRRRDATVNKKSICFNSDVAVNVCADIRTKTEYTCPNNTILRSIVEPNNPEITTLISNQTFGDMVYILNNNIYTLRPGEEKRYTAGSLSIQFNPACRNRSNCRPTTAPQLLQRGKRYQFKSSSDSIKLVDFPK